MNIPNPETFKLTKEDRNRIIGMCHDLSRSLPEFEKTINSSILRQPDTGIIYKTIAKRETEIGNKFPKDFYTYLASDYAVSIALNSIEFITHLQEQAKDELTSTALHFLDQFLEAPPWWSYFSIHKLLDNNFAVIFDYTTGSYELLYSPELHALQRSNDSCDALYITLIMNNGECLQTYGIIHHYKLFPEDIEKYASFIDPETYEDEGVDGIIANHTLQFFSLDTISIAPWVYQAKHVLEWHWKLIHLPRIETLELPGQWNTAKIKGNASHLRDIEFQGPDPRLLALEVPEEFLAGSSIEEFWDTTQAPPTVLHIDTSTGMVGMECMTKRSFQQLSCILAEAFPVLDPVRIIPDHAISMQLFVFLDRDKKDYILPWAEFRNQFLPQKDETADKEVGELGAPDSGGSKQKSLDMDAINAALQDLMVAHNTGRQPDFAKVAADHGIPSEVIEQVYGQLSTKVKSMIPQDFVLPDVDEQLAAAHQLQPPAVRRYFDTPLDATELFNTYDDEASYELFATLTNNSFNKEVGIGDLDAYISDLFTDELGISSAYHLMNAFFIMLLQKADAEPCTVRSYALAMVKMYHHMLIPKQYPDIDGFIATFSRFVYRKLNKNGIVILTQRPSGDVLAQGMYTVSPSEFLVDLLEIADLDALMENQSRKTSR